MILLALIITQTFWIEKARDTRDSQDVSDPSTNWALLRLTGQIGRDGVLSEWFDP